MTAPLWSLLGFVVWTVLVVLVGIAIYRVGSVLTGRAGPGSFPADTPHGPDWYRRVLRAHANCVENLPLFASVVLVGHVVGLRDPVFDTLSQVYLGARVGQTLAHVASGRGRVINVRFAFFATQVICLIAMIVLLARTA